MLYLNYIITTLFAVIIFNNIFNKTYFKATLVIISLSFIFNFSLILNNNNLKNVNKNFYTSYSYNSENKINEFQTLFLKKIALENFYQIPSVT